jgi:RNA polymerase sigma factor (sigma-70 family)
VADRPYIAIVECAQRGDLAAFAELVVAFQDLAVGTAFGWLSDIELAREATQEAFLDAHLHLKALREPAAFPAWLRTLVIKHCDRVTRRPRPRLASLEFAFDVPAAILDPDAEVAEAERAEWLRLAVEGLPAKERLVVALHYFADTSGPALAGFLELPLSTVKKRLRRARARLREEGDRLMQNTIDTLRPSRTGEFADEVTFFIALRAGDRARVAHMLSRTPELAHAQQQWAPSLVYEGVLPFASRATALLTAIERDDLEMQTLLLDAGADVDGVCGCATAESPVWAAALLNRIEHLRDLLRRGANPNVVAAPGNTPLHVAAMRGYGDVAKELMARGARTDAVDAQGHTPADWAKANGHAELASSLESRGVPTTASIGAQRVDRFGTLALFSGIKALDLFAPITRGGLVRVPFMAGVGMVVLLGELCKRTTMRADGRALWTGFAQRPFDLRDWQAEMAELGLGARVERSLVDFDASRQLRRDAFSRGLDRAEAMRDEGCNVLVVLLCEPGFESDVDASLLRLSSNRGGSSITTIVVTPFPEKREAVWAELSPPYKAQIVLDRRRAKKALFPSIDPLASLSDLLVDGKIEARHVDVARRARQVMERYAAIDPEFDLFGTTSEKATEPDVARAHRLLTYLRQPFMVAEPFTSRPGEWIAQQQLLDDVEVILGR